jgi:acetyl esterase
MALDRFAQRFLDFARASAGGSGEPTLADMRRTTEALNGFATGERKRNIATRDEVFFRDGAAIPVRFYWPTAEAPGAGLLYFHGGGWVSGSVESHDGLCRALADEGRCLAISFGYRLAPEHPFPTAIEDGYAVLAWLREQAPRLGIDPKKIAVGGDSAGANLSAIVCRMSVDNGSAPKAQLLLCPVLDARGRTPSRATLGQGFFLEERTMARYFEHYRVEGLTPDDPRVSPLRGADFKDLPPTRIHAAEYDPLCDEAALYAEVLARAGVDVRLTVHSGMIHHFYGLGDAIPYARKALHMIGDDLRALLA